MRRRNGDGDGELPARLADGEGEVAELLRKVERQPRQAPSEPAAWERTLRRLGRDSGRGRGRVGLAAAAGAVAGAVALYVALSRSAYLPSDPLAGDARLTKTHAPVPAPTGAPAVAPTNPAPAAPTPTVAAKAPTPEARPPAEAPRIQLGRAAVGLPSGRTELLGEAEVTLSRGGNARAFASAEAATVDLDAGEVALRVEKRPAEARHVFEVVAGAYHFTVLGTAFRVTRANGDVTLSVSEGRVAISRGGERLTVVTAGGFWAGTAASPRPAPRARTGTTTPAPRTVVARPASTPAGMTLAMTAPPDRAERTAPAVSPASITAAAIGAEGRLAPPPFVAPRPIGSGGGATRGCDARAFGGAATKARIDCLLGEARGVDLGAEVALYEAARLYRDALGDNGRAVETLRALRRRFPSGALAAEADLSLAELLPALGHYREALAESAAVLGSNPTPERADEIHLLRGDLLRGGLGDCRGALTEYAQVAEVARDGIADPATFFGAVCLQKLGDGPGARRAFQRYLGRPHPRHAAEATRRLRELER